MRKINVKILKDCKHIIKKFYDQDPDLPIYEQVKNLKIFQINDFYASKGALITHDIFDHFWFTSKLQNDGIFTRYQQLLQSLGNPHLYDIFSREGELFASIAFDFRSYHATVPNYIPLLKIEDIKLILQNSIKNHTFTENQQNAYTLLTTQNQNPEFYKLLTHIISGMAIELTESNRKNGFIKILNDQNKAYEYFDFFNPEHIAFIIEAIYLLFKDYNTYKQLLINISYLVETFLVKAAIQDTVDEFSVSLEDLESLDKMHFEDLSYKKVDWMKQHLGFETIRHAITD